MLTIFKNPLVCIAGFLLQMCLLQVQAEVTAFDGIIRVILLGARAQAPPEPPRALYPLVTYMWKIVGVPLRQFIFEAVHIGCKGIIKEP